MNWLISFTLLFFSINQVSSNKEKIELSELKVLTLYKDQMTTGRRNYPINQLKCIGGSAGCHSFIPDVVQCYNRGSDGYDVQWECKAEMDFSYKFGQTIVSCEGYEYPDDPYILKGSCGMEYTIEVTKSSYSSNNNYQGGNNYRSAQNLKNKSSWIGEIIFFIIVIIIVYAVYTTCVGNIGLDSDSTPNFQRDRPSGMPPPPGFRSSYMPNNDDYNSGSCGSTHYDSHTRTNHRNQNPFGGFWGGAATGGMLGYLFGSRTNTQYQQPYYSTPHNTGFGSFFSGGSSSGHHSSHASPSSSGSRTTSGFGGTRRR